MDRTHKYIYSEEHNFLYYEIQKCGTRSMLHYFVFSPDMDYGATRIIGKQNLPDSIDRALKFSFVRHPLQRLVSAYLSKFVVYNQHPTKPGIRHKDLYMHMPFEEFVEFVCATPDDKADVHFKSQHQFLPDFCWVGDMDNFRVAFELILIYLDLPRFPIQHRNTTNTTEWMSYYNDKTLKMAMERYAEDIDLFEYNNTGSSIFKNRNSSIITWNR